MRGSVQLESIQSGKRPRVESLPRRWKRHSGKTAAAAATAAPVAAGVAVVDAAAVVAQSTSWD